MRLECWGLLTVSMEDGSSVGIGPPPGPDTQYLTAYTSALHSALSAQGSNGLAVTSLHIHVSGPRKVNLAKCSMVGASSGVADALPALLLPQLQSACINISWKSVEGQACSMIQALEACPEMNTLHLATNPYDVNLLAMLRAASRLRQLRELLVQGCLQNECLSFISQDMPHTLQFLGCSNVILFGSAVMLSRIHTLSGPPADVMDDAIPGAAATTAAATENSSSMALAPGDGLWTPHVQRCMIRIMCMCAFPAVRCMQGVDLTDERLFDSPSQAQQLLSSLIEGQLASCAKGWALSLHVKVTSCRVPWSGRLPLGGLPSVQNVVLRIYMLDNVLNQLLASAVEGLGQLFAALPGMRQLLIKPSVYGDETKETREAYVHIALQTASIAVQQQVAWQGGHAQGGEAAAGAEVAGAGRRGCLHAVYIAGEELTQRNPEQFIPAGSAVVTSALQQLTAQCAMLHAESAAAEEVVPGVGPAAVRTPLQVHVAGVHGVVLEAGNAQLAAAIVPHRMLAW